MKEELSELREQLAVIRENYIKEVGAIQSKINKLYTVLSDWEL